MTARADYIAGLRALADLLDATPELELPHASGGIVNPVTFNWGALSEEDPAAVVTGLRRLIGGAWEKTDPGESPHAAEYYKLTSHLHGIDLEITAYRRQVCERVVTGTREVVEDVPVAFEKVTKTVEDIEWVCRPLLAEADAAVSS